MDACLYFRAHGAQMRLTNEATANKLDCSNANIHYLDTSEASTESISDCLLLFCTRNSFYRLYICGCLISRKGIYQRNIKGGQTQIARLSLHGILEDHTANNY